MSNHAIDKQLKEHLIKELIEKVSAMQHKFQSEDDEEKDWLIQNSPNPVVAELVKELTVMMLHVIDAIGKLEPVNGITISKQLGISKGSVSKITKKLVDRKVIQIEYLPDNKKEILFRTTPMGNEIYRLHIALHHQIEIGVNHFLQRYSEEELRFLVNTFQETLKASWVLSESNEEFNAPIQSDERTKNAQVTDTILTATVNKEMEEIAEMLNNLDLSNLKKAKTILKNVFFTDYTDSVVE
ncbi:winged helix DNA-binding protein [Paenibacillus macquariensis]|uniref:DNA-binding transcriptional regulator, MarR family n=1 Tax=Paenibacillus macquariensis TaxID=948756 RepID=A0ABY1JUZ2_9BACL|nr:winged helix DNA-binding protein [Paenibacillus macquariensis]MEC0090863.1 winged helix DNA-binding protein [Paenibacillus macquariensis]OAB34596.1 MarR family transcriptional regulator [Paenibacillus macquariensis subsp. macquariensis]SIQ81920.1 DNA-binding transcriptional regulator, MarR family [Paenibacillus macquariensis]